VSSAEQPKIRVDKVLEIRRQLGEGTYSIADRLDAVVDKIIEELREV
jgi:anti-sigma28 factor (negative regulator of flagellin synthesis)